MCYNKRCKIKKQCNKYKESSCIRKMSRSMTIEYEKIDELKKVEKKQIRKRNKKAKKTTVEDILPKNIVKKLKKIS